MSEAILGTGRPIRVTPADPGNDAYAASGLTLDRHCMRLRVIVGNSGVVVSLDGGTTDHVTLPPNTMDDFGVLMGQGSNIRVRRYTAGTAWTGLVLEVR